MKEKYSDIDYRTQAGINIRFIYDQIKKGEYNMMLENMSVEELKELQTKVEAELAEREREEKKEFHFDFRCSNDPRKGRPYAARLTLKNGKIKREFFDFAAEYGKREVLVYGEYSAKAGDIIEERQGGSWKNDYRYWFLVTDAGEKVQVASINNSREKARVIEYLAGEISAEKLLEEAE